MADEPQPVPPAPPSPAPVPLAEAPLAEYVERRAKGERPGPSPAPPGAAEPEPAAAAEPEAAPVPVPGETPEQAAAAKASRTRGELQRRLDSLQAQLGYQTRQNEKLQRERDEFLARSAQAQPPPPAQPELPLTPNGPVLEQFLQAGKSYEDWIDARIEYQAQRIADARIAQVQQQTGHAVAQQQLESAIAGFPQRADAVRAVHADFEDVVANNDQVILSPVMQDVCMRSDHGAEFMYWLGKHPDQANQLGEMTRGYPPQAFPLVEHHLRSLLTETPARGVPVAAPGSAAPPPITPLGGGSTNANSAALDQLPLGEYVRRRNAEAAARRNGGR